MNFDKAILRIFEATAKPGEAGALKAKFANTSVSVVDGKPGNLGFFFGESLASGEMMFVSIWEDLDAVKANFGEDWEQSYLPAGYAELIESYSVRHVEFDGRLIRQPVQ